MDKLEQVIKLINDKLQVTVEIKKRKGYDNNLGNDIRFELLTELLNQIKDIKNN